MRAGLQELQQVDVPESVQEATFASSQVVPAWEQKAWFRRALCRRNPIWRELRRFPGNMPLYFRGESARRRANTNWQAEPAPPLAAPPGWDTVVMTFP